MDLKFERKRSLSRLEAADQLAALADALRKGGEAEVELSPGTLSLRIPDDLRSEIEVEIGDGEIELEIEFTWPTTPPGSPTASGAKEATTRTRKRAPAKPRRSATSSNSGTGTKRSATKKP
ncbi:amphi-Trp domain-containing protein [Streptomyces canus]|uniref:amphi-Trp domain-containing protein n=1 Tax=Streptomyces canus TaxID=58343 RepID=UPI0027805C1D|nr:amphi-Trp domain-containing protein [Streptomyces canus]MDQ0604835.1 amphi-Trp domain-containing protein [Streptomyces canus]